MGLPLANWLGLLESHERNADAPSKVEWGLIDARFARKCEVYWAQDKVNHNLYLDKAVSN